MADMGTSATSASSLSPGKVDSAETFNESDVTVNFPSYEGAISASSIVAHRTRVFSQGGDYGPLDQDWKEGMAINPNEAIEKAYVQLMGPVGNVSRIFVEEAATGTILNKKTGSWSGGDWISITASMSAGEKYYIYVDDQGAEYSRYYDSNASYPYTSPRCDIVAGYSQGSEESSNLRNISAMDLEAKSATAYVEWPRPADLRSWDRAIFQRTLENESVDVYVEEDDGSGWTEIAGPVASGDEIPAATSSKVRFRIEISRSDPVANNPRLDAIYRRYVI